MSNLLNDKAIVDAFISYLRQKGYPNLKVERRPEEENRNSSDIEAIAGPFAIEHTSIDTIINQRRDSDWFFKAVGGLEELTQQLTCRLSITIPYEGVQIGQDWSKVRESFKAWIMNASPTLPDGMHIVSNEAGIPFEFHVKKSSERKPGLFFARFAPEDNSLPERIRLHLARKAQKLKPYKKQGYATILLVESDDIALMNENIMLDAIRRGFSNHLPEGVDQLWYSDTTIVDELLFYDFTESIQRIEGSGLPLTVEK